MIYNHVVEAASPQINEDVMAIRPRITAKYYALTQTCRLLRNDT